MIDCTCEGSNIVRLMSEVEGENCHSFEWHLDNDVPMLNIFGGIEISKETYETAVFENGVLYRDKFKLGHNCRESLNGEYVALRLCTPDPVNVNTWYPADWDMVKKFYDDFEEIPLTKSCFQTLIDSERYREPSEGI